MAEFVLKIEGMHCGACVRKVSEALKAVPGVTVNDVHVGTATVSADAAQAAEQAIAAVSKAGFSARLAS
jgi:copper chaperone CopZ